MKNEKHRYHNSEVAKPDIGPRIKMETHRTAPRFKLEYPPVTHIGKPHD